jgi:hypothetical protein
MANFLDRFHFNRNMYDLRATPTGVVATIGSHTLALESVDEHINIARKHFETMDKVLDRVYE